jgi:hypothetical protein
MLIFNSALTRNLIQTGNYVRYSNQLNLCTIKKNECFD